MDIHFTIDIALILDPKRSRVQQSNVTAKSEVPAARQDRYTIAGMQLRSRRGCFCGCFGGCFGGGAF
jgi:hypothetical protein